MKKTIIIIVFMFALTNLTIAADLLVTSTGQAGSYPSVSEALAASNDGDRIFVEPQAGNTPYNDNITINKSIQLLSNSETNNFRISGNITISPNAVINIVISGLQLDGSIIADIAAPSTTRSNVIILGSVITGTINFDQDNYDLLLSNSTVSSTITCRAGNFFGNILKSIIINQENETPASYYSDSLQIIGNRFDGSTTITSNSSKFYYLIANNYIKCSQTGINIKFWRDDNNADNLFLNNSIYNSSYSYNNLELGSVTSNVTIKIVNNAFDGSYRSGSTNDYTDYAINATVNQGNIYLGYNYLDDFNYYVSSNITYDDTNVKYSLGGADLGHPDPIYNDIDLSRNDIGYYGGPYSMENYIPSSEFSSKIIHLEIPRRILVGNTISVKVKAYVK